MEWSDSVSRKRKLDYLEESDCYSPQVGIIFNENLVHEFDKIPQLKLRGQMVHELIKSYGLLNYMTLLKSTPASEDDLMNFHSSDFIEYMKSINSLYTPDDSQDLEFGLGYDCPPLDGVYDYICSIAGSSLSAARAIISGYVDVAINWNGGWHHAHRDEVSGFCYVNDVVLSIIEMKQRFEFILYVDLDVHHGDGVEECFDTSLNVITLSMHQFEPGFYPGTGDIVDKSRSKTLTVNVPLKEGITDDHYTQLFEKVLNAVLDETPVDAIVVQCGADGLAGDPLGGFNLTPIALGKCLSSLLLLRKPTLILGGGGYNRENTARCWTYLTSIIVGKQLEEDIPEHKFFTYYGPSYELMVNPSNRKDANTKEYLNQVLEGIKKELAAGF